MGNKPETTFRARLRPRLDALPNSWWESIQQKAIHGTPDILGCVNGYFVALELKATPKDQPTKLQEFKLQGIGKAGGIGLIVHPGNVEQVMALLTGFATKETT